jgi:hypothetical protein
MKVEWMREQSRIIHQQCDGLYPVPAIVDVIRAEHYEAGGTNESWKEIVRLARAMARRFDSPPQT